MGKQDVVDNLTDEWISAKELAKKMNQSVSTLLMKLRKTGEVLYKREKVGFHYLYLYRKK
jgi:hypothetical protein